MIRFKTVTVQTILLLTIGLLAPLHSAPANGGAGQDSADKREIEKEDENPHELKRQRRRVEAATEAAPDPIAAPTIGGAGAEPVNIDAICEEAIASLKAHFNPSTPKLSRELRESLIAATAVLNKAIESRDDDSVIFDGRLWNTLAQLIGEISTIFKNKKIIEAVQNYNTVFGRPALVLNPAQAAASKAISELTLRTGMTSEERTRRQNGDWFDDDTYLLTAAADGRISDVRYSHEVRAANINAVNSNGDNALILAANNGHLPVVQYLANKVAKINAVNSNGDNALIIAADSGYLPVVQYLVDNRANINAVHSNGNNALILAADKGHLPVVQYLVDNRANINAVNSNGNNALIIAANNGHLPVVQYLANKVANINAVNPKGLSALMVASRMKHLSVIQYLLTTDADRTVAFTDAADKGNLDAIKDLVALGVDINLNNAVNHTALHFAAARGHLPVVQYLLAHGVNKEARADDGRTALHYAAQGGHLELVKWLIGAGADKEARTHEGYPILHLAVHAGKLNIIQWLISEHIVPIDSAVNTTTGIRNFTALHWAAQDGHLEIVQYLVAAGADINAKTDGHMVIHEAVHGGHLALVEWLINNAGVDKNVRDDNGWTPLCWARYQGHQAIINMLNDAGASLF